uniref:Gfo/Idh/MocA-like oxidoreductase N-terminal domain-containing protein n=1 Tax=Mucochytrium quahogii TaxID=96639 RepID=A0A7S2RVK7_9STRA|mmetsp:Transcript_22939/g.36552  ORF Transcript_22939/g.36552 Transcript_22939/m.36552 type:complete len:340 (+) Transcript_22939:152-1171(+)|eukprot:CAMPEP_0203754388 /NCGR_PEP_ID=MMETSP0098-20131031/7983_1 /ASSEMBLY_ACC=CAM_ASM_000208 /TAXON_ID=96639 /ORGANISM=" , Strain NY0313808BC1" /LENGTH=339 /DNA_ID=CAMNT_0050645359 /DNA_START=72 /DNA_END=1091 /DNA_ORIENTATION=-
MEFATVNKGKVGIAFIGVGDISELHAHAIRKCDHARLIGIWNYKWVDVSAGGHVIDVLERSSKYACEVYEELDGLLGDERVHAVYILTPLDTHYEYAQKVIHAGKHVLVEKPVGRTVEEIIQLENLAVSKGVLCVPGHNYIYEPQIKRMHDMIVNGSIGKLVQLSIYYNIQHGPEVTKNLPGIIRQIMTHHAYICLYLTGEPPRTLSAMKASIDNGKVENENVAMAMMQMASGAMSLLQASFANDDHSAEPWSFYIKVLGTKGSARYSYNDFVHNEKHTIHSHTYQSFPYTIENLTEHFVTECILMQRQPLSTLQDAATCVKILDAMENSINRGAHINL